MGLDLTLLFGLIFFVGPCIWFFYDKERHSWFLMKKKDISR